jgi:hypothetical protein
MFLVFISLLGLAEFLFAGGVPNFQTKKKKEQYL